MTATPTVDREALRRKSAPLLLCERARAQPDAIAFRCKHLGLYRERSWRDYAALVARTARAFAELGLARGERVAIMGDAGEQWLICDLAAQSLGAIVYGIYPTASAAEVEYQLRDGGAVMFIAENQEYVDKILPFADGLNGLECIIVVDDFGDVCLRPSQAEKLRCVARPDRAARPRLAGATGEASRPERSRLHRLHVGHHRSPQRARWSPTASISPPPRTWSSTIRRSRKSRTAPWPTCRSATCLAATSRSRCR